MTAQGAKMILFYGAIMATIAVVCGSLSVGFSIRGLVFFGLFGAMCGVLMAPEFEPHAFATPLLFQAVAGMLGGVLIVAALQLPDVHLATGAILGLLTGLTARYWLKHLTFLRDNCPPDKQPACRKPRTGPDRHTGRHTKGEAL